MMILSLKIFVPPAKMKIIPFHQASLTKNSSFINNIKSFIKSSVNPKHLNAKKHDSLINDEPIINCKDLGIDDFDFQPDSNTLSLFHQNIVSLERHKDNVLNGLSETRIKKNSPPKFSLKLPGYKSLFTHKTYV
jgi:hypothetical protein